MARNSAASCEFAAWGRAELVKGGQIGSSNESIKSLPRILESDSHGERSILTETSVKAQAERNAE